DATLATSRCSVAVAPTGRCRFMASLLSCEWKEPLGDHLPQNQTERFSVVCRELLPELRQRNGLAWVRYGRGGQIVVRCLALISSLKRFLACLPPACQLQQRRYSDSNLRG